MAATTTQGSRERTWIVAHDLSAAGDDVARQALDDLRLSRDVVIEAARTLRADRIVVGTHARRGLSRWALGSVAESIVRASPVPVLVVAAHTEE